MPVSFRARRARRARQISFPSGPSPAVLDSLEQRTLLAATLSGSVFRDITGNGLTADDRPLSGVVVKLHQDANANGRLDRGDRAVGSTRSNGKGIFSFSRLTRGRYILEEAPGANQVRTTPLFSDTSAVNLTKNGGKFSGFNFANYIKDFNRNALSNIRYTINGTRTVSDLLGNVRQGDTVTANFTVAAGKTVTLSLVSYQAPTSFGENLQLQTVFQSKTATFSGGTHSMTVKAPNCFFQIDFVGGPVIDKFGLAGSNIRYGIQGRLISFDNGGSMQCEAPGPNPPGGEELGDEGLTPGFWKNHTNVWGPTGLSPSQTLESVFDVPDSLGLDNVTLLNALKFGGGGGVKGAAQNLFRHAVAAVLNARHPSVDYALSYSDIVSRVNSALASNSAKTIESLKNLLDRYNNAGGGIDAHGRPV